MAPTVDYVPLPAWSPTPPGPLELIRTATMATSSLLARAAATGGHVGHDGGLLGDRALPSGCEPRGPQRGDWDRNQDADAGLAANPPRLLNALSTCEPLSGALSPARPRESDLGREDAAADGARDLWWRSRRAGPRKASAQMPATTGQKSRSPEGSPRGFCEPKRPPYLVDGVFWLGSRPFSRTPRIFQTPRILRHGLPEHKRENARENAGYGTGMTGRPRVEVGG